MTPLIDIVFILLIFVVLAANFDRVRGLKIELPAASNTQPPDQKPLVVTITEKGELLLQDKPIASKELPSELQRQRKRHKILLLQADGKVALQRAVFVLDQAARIGFEAVSIAAKKVASPSQEKPSSPTSPNPPAPPAPPSSPKTVAP